MEGKMDIQVGTEEKFSHQAAAPVEATAKVR
jgi:hypothetical protein